MPPLHTPYDGSSKPFSIGLTPLDLADWIEAESDLGALLAHKERLLAASRDTVFVQEPDTSEAQREVLELVVDHVLRRFPDIYRRDRDRVVVAPHGHVSAASSAGGGAASRRSQTPPTLPPQTSPAPRIIDLTRADAPLLTAARLVGEDLILMRRDQAGWRLAAGSLSFPSSWSLREKFGRPLQDIHAPVPEFGRGTRAAALIERIFDNLAVDQPVQRWNWSLQHDAELHLPFSRRNPPDSMPRWPGFQDEAAAAAAFIRVERQTLRRLPVSRDLLFTIRIHLDPLATLRAHPDRANLAAGLARQLESLGSAQLDYKGLAGDRDRLLGALRTIAAD